MRKLDQKELLRARIQSKEKPDWLVGAIFVVTPRISTIYLERVKEVFYIKNTRVGHSNLS